MMRKTCWVALVTLLLGPGLLLGGCSKLTQANYDQIQLGMTYQDVVDILGAPDTSQDVLGARNCIWGKDSPRITIKFVAQKVVYHSAQGLR